jgi:hypothetical protein
VTILGREAAEIDALVTDVYLESLLAGRSANAARPRSPREAVDAAVRIASARLSRDLPRFHPSFRFEERLAVRLAEAAAALRLPAAAGAEGVVLPLRRPGSEAFDPLADPLADPAADERERGLPRPLLIGGAMAASALSLAGAAWVAWRRSRTASPMARAVRAARARRPA